MGGADRELGAGEGRFTTWVVAALALLGLTFYLGMVVGSQATVAPSREVGGARAGSAHVPQARPSLPPAGTRAKLPRGFIGPPPPQSEPGSR